ncbi:lytic transglycosylase domain-containing protein [Streptomyces sp. VRA16 Mangrove soil]|uniref:lytic transglycosylase domain-containing protein n=1 Tax=Streptomyces sp. VRA16 Mangrove soil TaxID=2817434 RepID=UPI001A9D395A|nr:lytic transglycosylase domain-containing protein [Streptomyces sp. VRA16 Mangrove soil]MBO1335726.1 lytic transglycosylase domain-containing protein [Streptomyces sp. VRA16 Mangrove soil]
MAGRRTRWGWLALVVAAVVVWGVVVRGGHASSGAGATPPGSASGSPSGGAPSPASSAPASPSSASSAPATSSTSQRPTSKPSPPSGSYDPADYAPWVRTRAGQAGVSARLVMAILYNEAYKPHDPSLERAWQRYKPDAAFGVANMHRATYDETRRGRDFAGRSWDELPDDPDLAIEAEAWHLHDLAAQLPAHWSGPYTRDELLALGYNTGAGNMLAFARGASPGSQARSYLDRLHANWDKAGRALGA